MVDNLIWAGSGAQSYLHRMGVSQAEWKALQEGLLDTGQQEDSTPEDAISNVILNRDEVVSACHDDLNFLAATALPLVFEHEFPPVHQVCWQLLTEGAATPDKRFPQIALGIPRAHAKTTLIKLWMLWLILFTSKKFILVLCDTAANAENIIADVAAMLSEKNIIELFGDWRMGVESNTKAVKKFAFRGRIITIAALGAGGSVRGLNVDHARPDAMIFDDVQTKECSESIIQSAALERWMIGTAMKAKSPSGCVFVWIGNVYPGSNSILKKLRNNATWTKFISGAILADGTALWPELHSVEDLVQELDNDIAMGHPEIFFSEVLNDSEAGINSVTDLSKIKPWPYQDYERPQGKFIIIDPANNKVGGDLVNIGLFEVYDAVPALREVIEENLSPGNTIRKALLLAIKNNVRLIVVESTAYQYTLLYWFTEVCRQLGITGIECADIYSGFMSKNSRIAATLKCLTAGEIILHTDVRSQVIHQITNWNPLKRENVDGILDLLSYAIRVLEEYAAGVMVDDSLLMLESSGAVVQAENSPF